MVESGSGKIFERLSLPVIDISGDTRRHVMVAEGTPEEWQGHPHTVLLPDGRTMFCVWQGRRDGTGKHGAPAGFIKRSDDGGLTWSALLDVPSNWMETGRGAPTIHYLEDSKGVARIHVFCRDEERTSFLRALSEDGGKTWSPMTRLPAAGSERDPIKGWTAPITIAAAAGNGGERKHLMFYERDGGGAPAPGVIWCSSSRDGGLSWGESRPVVEAPGACEPAVIRSPDGRQLLLLIRQRAAESDRRITSFFSLSDDEGMTWSEAKALPLALTGDRHLARYAHDGRLVVVFRPRILRNDPDSHFTAWVGSYEDIISGREGEYRLKLLHSYAGWDHTYPGLEVLPDGMFAAATYIKYRPGEELHSVVSVRFYLEECDRLLCSRAGGA